MTHKFVRGGSDEARLIPYERKEMAEKRVLTDKERQGIYTMHCLGESKEAIADSYKIAVSTVYRIIREQREKREEKDVAEVVVAGDKRNGRLFSVGTNRYEGTCIVGGKSKKRTFTAINAKNAQQQWEKWCQTLRDEQDFLDMVERNVETREEPKQEQEQEPQVVCGYPLDPIEEIRPTKQAEPPTDEEIYEAQEAIDTQTERVCEAVGVPLADTSEPAYLIWAKSPEPRCYGLYLTMEAALAEMDRLNEVARFLGGEGAFEVEEVAWRV